MMEWFDCEECGKLTRSKQNTIICTCGMVMSNAKECEILKDIPPNPYGKIYKENKKCDQEMKKMVMNIGRE